MSRPPYVPSPEEIRKACLALQDGWTEADERFHRTGSVAIVPWTTTEIVTPRDRRGDALA